MKKVFLSLGVVSLLAVQSHAQALFFDSFDTETQGLGRLSLTNWTITNPGVNLANVDVIGSIPSAFFDVYAGQGHGNYVDLDGTGTTVSTVLTNNTAFALVGGTKYTFVFDLGKNGSAAESMTARVFDATTLTPFTLTPTGAIAGTGAIPSFTQQVFTFTPSVTTTGKISFTQNNPADSNGYIIDNVALGIIPEPTTLALALAMGLPFVIVSRRRRNG